MISKSQYVGLWDPCQMAFFAAYKWGLYTNYLHPNWDDPPSRSLPGFTGWTAGSQREVAKRSERSATPASWRVTWIWMDFFGEKITEKGVDNGSTRPYALFLCKNISLFSFQVSFQGCKWCPKLNCCLVVVVGNQQHASLFNQGENRMKRWHRFGACNHHTRTKLKKWPGEILTNLGRHVLLLDSEKCPCQWKSLYWKFLRAVNGNVGEGCLLFTRGILLDIVTVASTLWHLVECKHGSWIRCGL